MRNALVASAAVHVALVAGLLFVRPAREVLVPGPDVVQVALVDAALAAVPPPAPLVKAAPEPVAPAEEQGLRIEKSAPAKAKPRPEPERAKVPPSPAPAPAAPAMPATRASSVVLPWAPAGGGLRGQVAVDESNFEFAYYLQQVRSLIARNWTPPAGAAQGAQVVVYFRVTRDGTLTAPRVETSSGNAWFDQAATRAVVLVGHLPPLPLGYAGADLGIHFGFEYAGP